MTIADRLASFTCDTNYADIDPAVIERAKDLCISSLGSAVLGATMDVPRTVAQYVREQGSCDEASVIGFAFGATAEQAAMINCDSSHCTELEDVAWPEAQYTCCIIPAVFTLAQALGSSGRDVIEAVVIGFEVAARPGMVCSNGGAAARGWLSCANVGVLGVAAASARLMKLDFAQTRDAITLAASLGGGLVRQTGSGAHVVEAGFVGRDGIAAARLAARGIGGHPRIFDGEAGYFDALAGQPDLAMELGAGRDFRIMAVGQKKYPCCYMLQRTIDALKAAMADHGFSGEDVEDVMVEVNAAFPAIMKYDVPTDVEEARFSLQHVVAATLAGEAMDVRSFAADKVADPRIAADRGKVRMVVHPEWGYDQLGAQDIITVTLRDGRQIGTTAVRAHGDADDPLSRAETLDKFMRCTKGLLPPGIQAETAAMLEALETLTDVAPLMTALSAAPAFAE
ncbi:MmgE/PrpD family protein [Novosphingobium lindaniclasticum]|uniref:MmgE/PrpD family protein n=1 Tax=Novosphingobium lindaniclasticum LE124 TaxID=1096930 RepID=T0HD94_9SPHN|nr:MmgE/PrpD family protein [Novosphingobium lindaniclasticum]EQB14291.1 hypothetical protein L284_12920 [Novosphingobium lindaniclasticum LE124]